MVARPSSATGSAGACGETRGEEARGLGPSPVGERVPAGERRIGAQAAGRRGSVAHPESAPSRHQRDRTQRRASRARLARPDHQLGLERSVDLAQEGAEARVLVGRDPRARHVQERLHAHDVAVGAHLQVKPAERRSRLASAVAAGRRRRAAIPRAGDRSPPRRAARDRRAPGPAVRADRRAYVRDEVGDRAPLTGSSSALRAASAGRSAARSPPTRTVTGALRSPIAGISTEASRAPGKRPFQTAAVALEPLARRLVVLAPVGAPPAPRIVSDSSMCASPAASTATCQRRSTRLAPEGSTGVSVSTPAAAGRPAAPSPPGPRVGSSASPENSAVPSR